MDNSIHHSGMYNLLSASSSSTPLNSDADHYLKTGRMTESNFGTAESVDVFICGRCNYQFKDMCQFMNHKQSGCGRGLTVSELDTDYSQQYSFNSHSTLHEKIQHESSLHVMMGSGMPTEPNILSEPTSHKLSYNQSALEQLNMDNSCESALQPGNLTRQLLVDRNAGNVSGISDISISAGDSFLEVPTSNDDALLFGVDKDSEVFSFLQPTTNTVYCNNQQKINTNLQTCSNPIIDPKQGGFSHPYEAHNHQTLTDPIPYTGHEANFQRPNDPFFTQNTPYHHSYHHDPNSNYPPTAQQDYHEMLPPPGIQNSSFSSDLLSAAPLPNNSIISNSYYSHHQHQETYQQPHLPQQNYVNIIHTENNGGYLPPISEIPLSGKCTDSRNLALENIDNGNLSKSSIINNQPQVCHTGSSDINVQSNLSRDPSLDKRKVPVETEVVTRPVVSKKQKPVLYKCQYCERGFNKNYDLEQHSRTHTGEKPYQCIVCGRAFSQRSNVKKHMRSHKVWPSEVSTLPEVHTIGVRLDCNKQLIIRPTKSIDSVIEKREYRLLNNPNCDGNGKQTTEEPIVLVDNSFECRFCKQRFQDYYSLRSHMRQHKDQQVYLCVLSTCKRTFRELSAFLEHLEEHKREREMIYACYMCKQQFSSLYQLGEHYNQHRDNGNSLSCPACKKTYSTVLHLQQHLAVCSHCHVCSHCDKGFSSEAALRRHIAIHATIPQFQCHVCSRSFKTKGYLKFHLRSHQGSFAYNCSVCNKGFQRQDKLRLHEALHRSDQRLRCPLSELSGCSYTCTRKDLLVQHVTSHWRWVHRPAACAICKYRFTSYHNLRRHQKMHKKRGALLKHFEQQNYLTSNVDIDAEPTGNSMVCPLCSRQFQRQTPFDNHTILCKQRVEREERRRIRRLAVSKHSTDTATTSIERLDSPELLQRAPSPPAIHSETAQASQTSPLEMTRSSRRCKFTPLWKPKKTRKSRRDRQLSTSTPEDFHPQPSAVSSTSVREATTSLVLTKADYQLPQCVTLGNTLSTGHQQQTLPSIATLNPLNFVVDNDSSNFFSEPLSFLQSLDPLGHSLLSETFQKDVYDVELLSNSMCSSLNLIISKLKSPGKEGGSSAFIRRRRQRTVDGQPITVPRSSQSSSPSLVDSDDEADIDTSKTVGPLAVRSVLGSEKTLFLALLAFRLTNSLLIQTSFVPDEYWQSVEVAHNWAFGYGYLTWEWRVALRSPLYPLLFASVFKLLAILGLDSRLALVKLPRLLQGGIAALADFYLYKFSRRVAGQSAAQWSLFCQLVNWFTFFTATRTLTNGVEWMLTTLGLAYYPWPHSGAGTQRKAQWKFVLVVAVSVLLRPTAAVQWLPLCLFHLYSKRRSLFKLMTLYILVGGFTLGLSALIEKHFYSRWTLSQWNFLQFNLLSDVSRFYGVHSWHWYLTQGWPVLLFTQLPLFFAACFTEWSDPVVKLLLGVIVWTIYIYSFLAHKEFRFLFPLLPMALHLCGRLMARWNEDATTANSQSAGSSGDGSINSNRRRRCYIVIGLLLVTHAPVALYTGLVHQRGGVDFVMALGRQLESEQATVTAAMGVPSWKPDRLQAMFLTPCHSTPYYSHIHQNVSLRFLTCEPELSDPVPGYLDEADQFFEHPRGWVQRHFGVVNASVTRPLYWVMFDELLDREPQGSDLADLLQRWGYSRCRTFFHTHFGQGRQSGRLIVYCADGVYL